MADASSQTSRDLHMLFAPVAHADEGLSHEALLTLRVEKSLICLLSTQGPTVSITEQQLILFL
jgi:hypothetical protein